MTKKKRSPGQSGPFRNHAAFPSPPPLSPLLPPLSPLLPWRRRLPGPVSLRRPLRRLGLPSPVACWCAASPLPFAASGLPRLLVPVRAGVAAGLVRRAGLPRSSLLGLRPSGGCVLVGSLPCLTSLRARCAVAVCRFRRSGWVGPRCSACGFGVGLGFSCPVCAPR